MPYSIGLFEAFRPNVCDIELDHDDVSSVVVLLRVSQCNETFALTYSFANTPLQAAQAPLMMASNTQEDFGFVLDIVA